MALTQGSAGASEEFLVEGTAALVAACADLGKAGISYGANLLNNGDFSQSGGTAAGPNWATDYTIVAGPAIPSTAGQMALDSTGGIAGTKAYAVNVSDVLTSRIFYWSNIYLEAGQTYQFSVDLKWNGTPDPLSIGVSIDGGAYVVTLAGTLANTWQSVAGTFTFTGATGYHVVSVNSNSAILAGNDGLFDNVALRKAALANTEATTNVSYGAVAKVILDQIVRTAGCNDDRRDAILAEISSALSANATVTTLESNAVVLGGVAAVTQTFAALLPSGKRWVAVSVAVLSGTADLTDAAGNVAVGLPMGFTVRWEAPATGVLSPPTSITVNANSQVAISFTVKS